MKGVALRDDRRAASFDRDQMVRDYMAEGSTMRLAARYGVCQETIKRELHRRNVPIWSVAYRTPLLLKDEPVVLAYLAAMIDGEGSIYSYPHLRHVFGVSVYNTAPSLMEWLSANVGGRVWWSKAGKGNDGHRRKPIGHWHVNDAISIHMLLRKVRPYLVIKGALADSVMGELELKYPNLRPTAPPR